MRRCAPLAAALALAGCATVPSRTTFEATGLDGEWRIVSLSGRPIDGSMQIDRGRVTVNFGCNLGSGTLRIEGGRLVVGPLRVTRMACAEPTPDRVNPMTIEGEGFAILALGRVVLIGWRWCQALFAVTREHFHWRDSFNLARARLDVEITKLASGHQ